MTNTIDESEKKKRYVHFGPLGKKKRYLHLVFFKGLVIIKIIFIPCNAVCNAARAWNAVCERFLSTLISMDYSLRLSARDSPNMSAVSAASVC